MPREICLREKETKTQHLKSRLGVVQYDLILIFVVTTSEAEPRTTRRDEQDAQLEGKVNAFAI